jgi:hypothetical protein
MHRIQLKKEKRSADHRNIRRCRRPRTTTESNPAAPSTNNARLYVRDNGAGKTQLVVRFPTGAIQIIATEP